MSINSEQLAQDIVEEKDGVSKNLIKYINETNDPNDISNLFSNLAYLNEDASKLVFPIIGLKMTKDLVYKQLDAGEDFTAGLYSASEYLLSQNVDVNVIHKGKPILLQAIFLSDYSSYEHNEYQTPQDRYSFSVNNKSLRAHILQNGADISLLETGGSQEFLTALNENNFEVTDAFFAAGYQLNSPRLKSDYGEPTTEIELTLNNDTYDLDEILDELYSEVFSNWSGQSKLDDDEIIYLKEFINRFTNSNSKRLKYLIKKSSETSTKKINVTEKDLNTIFKSKAKFLNDYSARLFNDRVFNFHGELQKELPNLSNKGNEVQGQEFIKNLMQAYSFNIKSLFNVK